MGGAALETSSETTWWLMVVESNVSSNFDLRHSKEKVSTTTVRCDGGVTTKPSKLLDKLYLAKYLPREHAEGSNL